MLLLLSGDRRCRNEGLAYAHRIAAHTGCRLMAGGSNARTARGQGRIPVDRVPYVVEVAVKALAGTKHLILAGARKPVTFFAYPGKVQTSVPPDADLHVLARPEQDIVEALGRLAEAVGAPKVAQAGQRTAAGGRARRADAGIGGEHGWRADAGRRGDRRRVGDLRPRFLPADQSGAAA